MTDTVGVAVIELGVDSGGVDAGLARVEAGVQRTGRTLANLGTQGSAALESIGAGGVTAAARVDNTTRSLIGSVERATAALEAGKKSGADYFETLARNRGADLGALAPFIAQLREVEAAQSRAAAAANETRIAQEAAAEAARAESLAQREAAQALAGRDTFLAGLREQIALYGRSSEEVLRYRAAQAGIAHDADPLIDQLRDLRTAHEQVAAAARAESQAQREAAQVQTNQNSFVASLEQQANAIGRTRSQLLEMQAAQLGVTDQAAPFIARLREAETVVARTGTSAAQTAAALRGVPAQFTDIVTSIQGGQAPLTVFLQQGGQLRDMFGGAAPAARALGGYIVGLINPFTLAAAGAAALAIAYNQGSKEADAYARSLILTGNAAGTTSGQLTDMARSIGKTVGTQGDAAAALAALAGTGKVGVDNLQRFATVAVKAQRDIGVATSETAKDFADLAKSPLQATEKLNEQYHYLTGSIYAQIKALQDQGRIEEAGEVAQKAYAAALEDRSGKLEAHLGSIQKGWRGVTDYAKGAWDAMLDVGREETLEQKLAKVQATLQKLRAESQGSQKSMLGGGDVGFNSTQADSERTKQALALEASLKQQIDAQKRLAAIDADKQKFNEADTEWQKTTAAFLPRQIQLTNELKAVREKGEAAGIEETAIVKAQGEVRKKYADIYNDAIDAQIEKIKRLAAIEQERDKRTGISLAAARATGLSSSVDLDIENARNLEALDQEALARDKKKLQAELDLTKQKLNSQKAQADLVAQLNLLDEKSLTRKAELKKQIADLDIKDTKQAAIDLADLADKRGAELQSLKDQMQAQQDSNSLIGASKEQINDFNKALVNERATRLENQAAIIGNTEGRKKEADAMLASAATMRSLAQAQADGLLNTERFDQQKKLWESIDQTAHDTFVNIFTDGKNAFDRLRDTLKAGLLDLLYQMTIKKWIFNIGAQVSGYSAIGSLGGGTAAAGAAGLGQAGSLLQVGKGIYDGVGTGFTGLAGSLGSGLVSLGGMTGSSSLSAFGAGVGSAGMVAPADAAGLYAAAGGAGSSGAVTAGAYGGAAVTAAAGIAAGVIGGHLISGQYGSNSTVNAGTAIGAVVGSIVPVIGTAVGALVGGLIGGALNRAFGMGDKKVTDQGITGTLTSDSFTGENFANWHQDGGWFRSDKNGTDRSPVDSSVSKAFVDTYAQLKTVTGDFAKALGADADSLAARSQSLNIALTSDIEANKTAIGNFFSSVADTMAKELVPSLVDFTKEGETASTTLQRLAGDYKSVDLVLMTIGRTSQDAFGAVGVASIAARERLIAAAGSIDALSSGTAYFAQNFLSPAEQIAPIVANVKKQLADLGGAGVATNDQFKALVLTLTDSGKLATEEGAKQYAALLQLAPQFKQVTDYMGSLNAVMGESAQALSQRADLQKQFDEATMTSAQLVAQQRAALDPSNRLLFDQVQAAQAAKTSQEALASVNASYQKQIDDFIKSTSSATDVRAMETKGMDASTVALYDRLAGLKAESLAQQAAAAAIQKARDSSMAGLQALGNALADSMRNAEAAGKALNEFSKSLLLGDLSPLNPEDRYKEARRQLLSSDPGDTATATAFLNASKARDAGDFSYSRDFALVQSRIASAAEAQFSLAASIPAAWAQVSQFYREQMAPGSASPAQNLVAPPSATPASTGAMEDALTKMGEKVVAALTPIATNTEKTAAVLDLVTEGGSAMLVTS